MTYIAYYRVSTDKQGINGLGMDAQREIVQRFGKDNIIAEFTEVESGKRSDRVQLGLALKACKATGSTLLIAKLDRLARNVAFISGLMESGVEFVAADMPTANRLTVHILAAVAEHEALVISQRTKAALAQAKQRGVLLGGYRGPIARASEGQAASVRVRRCKSLARIEALAPILDNVRQCGHTSLRAIAAELNRRNIKAPRGGAWNAKQVQRITA